MTLRNFQEKPPDETTIFKTTRLMAREWSPADARHLYLLNSDPEVLKYTGDKPFKTPAHARVFIENYRDYQRQGFGRWVLFLTDTNSFVGWCGLKKHQEWVDLGFRLLKKYWGQGYATEAAAASLRVGFLKFELPQIIGRASYDNTVSIRVLEKLHMRFWKRDACDGIPNAAYYRITRAEYLSFQ
jgi:RimJ/RimL family protein N-acetyltransferase